MLGFLGVIVLHAHQLSDYFKEQIKVSIILKDKVKEADVYGLQNMLKGEPYIKSSQYLTKEEAAQEFQENYDEDFMEFLGFNPLYAHIDIYLNAKYANEDSILLIKESLLQQPVVKEITYQKGLVESVNENARKIGVILLAVIVLLLIVAITAIDSTMRLAMYSNRFLIKTMQLIGATRWFITKPFMLTGVRNGLISGILAILALAGCLYYAELVIPDLANLRDLERLSMLFGALLLLGMVISWWSTYRSVRKYLRMKLENLY
jgi:cell division transport system permease protein